MRKRSKNIERQKNKENKEHKCRFIKKANNIKPKEKRAMF